MHHRSSNENAENADRCVGGPEVETEIISVPGVFDHHDDAKAEVRRPNDGHRKGRVERLLVALSVEIAVRVP